MFRTQLSPRNLSYELPFSSVAVAGQTCSPFFPVKKTQISAFLERFLHVLGTHRVTSGWWGLPKPLWKMMEWKSVGMIIHSQYDGKVIIHSCSKPPTSLFCCWLHPLCLMVYPCFVHWIRCFLLLPPSKHGGWGYIRRLVADRCDRCGWDDDYQKHHYLGWLPSGKHTKSYWKWPSRNSEFSH